MWKQTQETGLCKEELVVLGVVTSVNQVGEWVNLYELPT